MTVSWRKLVLTVKQTVEMGDFFKKIRIKRNKKKISVRKGDKVMDGDNSHLSQEKSEKSKVHFTGCMKSCELGFQ